MRSEVLGWVIEPGWPVSRPACLRILHMQVVDGRSARRLREAQAQSGLWGGGCSRQWRLRGRERI